MELSLGQRQHVRGQRGTCDAALCRAAHGSGAPDANRLDNTEAGNQNAAEAGRIGRDPDAPLTLRDVPTA